MRKSNASFKAAKSIANKTSVRRTANKKDISFKNTETINNKIKLFKENEKVVFNFLEGTKKNLSPEIKDAAKVYFLFKLKNEQFPTRHKPSQDESVKSNHLLYKKYIEKLS
jgi:hypothetical protein